MIGGQAGAELIRGISLNWDYCGGGGGGGPGGGGGGGVGALVSPTLPPPVDVGIELPADPPRCRPSITSYRARANPRATSCMTVPLSTLLCASGTFLYTRIDCPGASGIPLPV